MDRRQERRVRELRKEAGAWKGAAAISDSLIFLFDLRAALESEEKKTGFFGFMLCIEIEA